MLQAVEGVYAPTATQPAACANGRTLFKAAQPVAYQRTPSDPKEQWLAIGFQPDPEDRVKFVIVKQGSPEEYVSLDELDFT
jgi:hypothetical protein